MGEVGYSSMHFNLATTRMFHAQGALLQRVLQSRSEKQWGGKMCLPQPGIEISVAQPVARPFSRAVKY
jgi:hypothetical protein